MAATGRQPQAVSNKISLVQVIIVTSKRIAIILLLLFAVAATAVPATANKPYPWREGAEARDSLCERIKPPRGYRYERQEEGSFAEWLLHLPLKPGRPPVYLYNGKKKPNQTAHVAVLDLDVGCKSACNNDPLLGEIGIGI